MRPPLCFCVYKNTKIQSRESALPFFSFPLLLHLVIHTPMSQTAFYYVPFRHLGYPISPFGVSHFAFWGIPFYHLGCPILPFGVSHFAFWGIPFCHLGYPILPFGMSHFAIWDVPFRHLGYPIFHLGYPISPFGMSHFAIWGILRRVYAPILAPFYPLFALIFSHFRGKNGRQNVCLSPQLSGNQIPSHQCVTCKPVSEFLYLPLSIF